MDGQAIQFTCCTKPYNICNVWTVHMAHYDSQITLEFWKLLDTNFHVLFLIISVWPRVIRAIRVILGQLFQLHQQEEYIYFNDSGVLTCMWLKLFGLSLKFPLIVICLLHPAIYCDMHTCSTCMYLTFEQHAILHFQITICRSIFHSSKGKHKSIYITNKIIDRGLFLIPPPHPTYCTVKASTNQL